ncbi:hypothetical protein SAMN02745857_02791 [Andreprevotia lacus DSM 23236]|jgi:hypothetical protein|uniref:Uncharacterized protein n=1 Tax=Andreprevotia lacus DSM 23236 TaxID=1121001 RepID=A0A1W1XTV7_9NEIS|nr:hypothetical protein [Andreprevotia lacus]SMC27292.1 hypothetical protein SAMN02745857_02791 [Andreprevotia lacus DSM 23236]
MFTVLLWWGLLILLVIKAGLLLAGAWCWWADWRRKGRTPGDVASVGQVD